MNTKLSSRNNSQKSMNLNKGKVHLGVFQVS